MDPEANIKEQRAIAARLLAIIDRAAADTGQIRHQDRASFEGDAVRLAELVQALAEWRSKGGFDPEPDPHPGHSDPVPSLKGVITLADGSRSEFNILPDAGWNQWGATTERLGMTGQLVEDLAQAAGPYLVEVDEDGESS